MRNRNITIYTIPTCSDCHDAKRYFQEQGLEYMEKDCTTDPRYPQEVWDLTKKKVVPTIVIDDEVWVGFGEHYEEIDQYIQEKK